MAARRAGTAAPARPAAIRAAAAPLVAFMDDDLELEPGWLDALVDVLASTAADVAVGPVRPNFAVDGPADWDPTGARFTRALEIKTGSQIAASGPAKPADFALSTASSLWRAATCFTDMVPFDPNFGACGGEDFDLDDVMVFPGPQLLPAAVARKLEHRPATSQIPPRATRSGERR